MIRVPLSGGGEALLDDEDADLAGFAWRKDGFAIGYAMRRLPRVYHDDGRVTRANQYMHRVVAERAGVGLSHQIDHVNRDRFDNRRNNLRSATPSQNRHNVDVRSDSRSGVKGVSWDSERRMWTVSIRCNYKQRNLGRFRTLRQAADAYREASLALHGNYSIHAAGRK